MPEERWMAPMAPMTKNVADKTFLVSILKSIYFPLEYLASNLST
jgi:hypothetical protein